ncbi:MAG: hypothetical protein E7503_00490 [Ruminococcus sp.]|nr:hypothetical protein [Ruminococcus sp.]
MKATSFFVLYCEFAQKFAAIFYQKALETSEKIMYNKTTTIYTHLYGVRDFDDTFMMQGGQYVPNNNGNT